MKFLSNLLLCAALSSPTLVAGADWLIARDSLALTGTDVVTGTFSVTAPAASTFTYQLLDYDDSTSSCVPAVTATGLDASAAPAGVSASTTAATFTVDATIVSSGLSGSSFYDTSTKTIMACMRIEITNTDFGEVMNRIDAPFTATVTVSGSFASLSPLSIASGAISSLGAGAIATTASVSATRVLVAGDVDGQIQAGSPLQVAITASDDTQFTVTTLETLKLVRDKGKTNEFEFDSIVSTGNNSAEWTDVASVSCATGTCTVVVNLPFSFFEVAGTTATLEGLANLVVNRRVLTEDGRELQEATRELGEFSMTLDAQAADDSSSSGLAAAGAITASIVFTLLA